MTSQSPAETTLPTSFDERGGDLSNSLRDSRHDRSIRPLGSARRPGRSRTPTPSNPHPALVSSGTNRSTRDHLSHRLNLSGSTSSAFKADNNSTAPAAPPYSPNLSSTRSRSIQAQTERRPWFPYPAPTNPSSRPERASSSSARRISNLSTDSLSSNSNASTSSASSYNSENITTRLNRRAASAEPEQWSQAASRGRLMRDNSKGSSDPRARKDGIPESEKEGVNASIEEREAGAGSSSSDEEKERAHFKSVLRAFDAYLSHSVSVCAHHSRSDGETIPNRGDL
jgi:hypothetical protein